MVAVNIDIAAQLKGTLEKQVNGLGRQRLQLAQQKAIQMLNSFRIDFSGQTAAVIEQVNKVGKLVHHKNVVSDKKITPGQSSICQIEGSKILSQDYARDHQITKQLPPFTETPQLLFRLSDHEKVSNRLFHQLCDEKGPLLVLVKTKYATFGGYCSQSWKSIGGYRKCKTSYLFRLSEPLRFISKVSFEDKNSYDRALFFNGDKYGVVFGQGDLNIDFDDIKKSSSKLGQTFHLPEGVKRAKNDYLFLTGSKQTEFGADILEVEVFGLKCK